jgi:glycosyltransferase involved in cell wall biosynthesis
VEATIYHHARLLADGDFDVRVLAGRGATFHPSVTFESVEELDARHPRTLEVKRELDGGSVTARFSELRDHIAEALWATLQGTDVLIVHNAMTLHNHLALTAALYQLLVEKHAFSGRVLGWHHDLAWPRPDSAAELHPGYPWELLKQPWPGVKNVVVSEPRRVQLAALFGIDPGEVAVVPPGVDPERWLCRTDTARHIAKEYGLFDADMILLLPARITRRKNIELAVQVLACLRDRHRLDARLLVTGPPGPHNPANIDYLNELLAMRESLGLEKAALFLYEAGVDGVPFVPDDQTVASLYALADALLFPSVEEGFGIPVLEAGITRLPVFCSCLPSMISTGGDEAHYFRADASPAVIAGLIAKVMASEAAFALRKRVLRNYSWERIVAERVVPLLNPRPLPDRERPS